jgi:predicted GTPase
MGAAGRDFHDFATVLRARPEVRVVCFTAQQIPFIEDRTYPPELAGPGYPDGIPIHPEEALPRLIREHEVDLVFLSYTDLSHAEVMHQASIVQAAGASFALLGPRQTQLESRRPVIAVTAARTGAGKSPLSQALARHLTDAGRRVGVLRHPMPYGELAKQAVQRFAEPADLDRHECTVEEREEYEPYLEMGLTVWAGVDYARILAAAEEEADVILWDGGNNDASFVAPDLSIVVLDALRPGHELSYYPSETNLRRADVVVVSKVAQAAPGDVERVKANARDRAPGAALVEADLEVTVDDAERLWGARALVVEDGPTLTHGGMASGAGRLAAERAGATIVDPRPHAVGTLAEAYARYAHLGDVLPALGYSEAQRAELKATVEACAPDLVVDASPARLDRLLDLSVPLVRVRYRFAQRSGPDLLEIAARFLDERADPPTDR